MMSLDEMESLANSFRRKPKKNQSQQIQTDETIAMIEILESDMNKFRIENLRLQQQIKQLQESLVHCSVNLTNTSSKFMLPSEFKLKYENMVKETLPSAFGYLFDQPKVLVQVVQQSCLFLEQVIRDELNNKTLQIASILGINSQGLFSLLQKLYQDNYQSVLGFNEMTISKLKSHLKLNIKSIDEFIEEDNDDLIEWMKQYWLLLSYIILSDQEINIGFSRVIYEIVSYQKNEYYCVDGFGKEGAKSLVILPPIMRKNQSFNGVKHAVLILPNNFDCSIFSQENNLQDTIQELKSYNSPKQLTIPQESKVVEETKRSSLQYSARENTFQSQGSEKFDTFEEYRIKPQQKQPLKSMKETLNKLNQYNNSSNNQSFKEISKLLKQDSKDNKKFSQLNYIQNKISDSNWSRILNNKRNKENNQHLNQSQYQQPQLTIQQFLKKIQIDFSRPLKSRHDESKFIKSQQDSFRQRAQSNDGKFVKYYNDSFNQKFNN
ncbi:unnamed protein product [Paramecium octaurelia]|uniref:Uncharacterized protein n=1 Tax=Paramecium octaurelia TaxID=43137 RepID=A0A8S1UMF9_PAROT|nr:unnamed protein product [Paramecium octaurelia]